MDSITQIVLGAAVGEAIAGRKVGYRAALWGACLGTMPDLDILAAPLLDEAAQLRFHRGFTHSFLFSILSSPLIGWGVHKFHKIDGTTVWMWIRLALWVHVTHVLIDLATTYGTQMFHPLTDTPFTLDLIFIIDPLFTLPLLLGLIFAFIYRKKPELRRKSNLAGLSISSAYLILALGIKAHVHHTVENSFLEQYGQYEIMKTTPAGPSILLWNGYVVEGDTFYQASYSVFDRSRELHFREIPKNSHLLEPYWNDRGTRTLRWFARGYYTVQQRGEEIVFYDLRFGRTDLWLSDKEESYMWANALRIDESGEAVGFEQIEPSLPVTRETFTRFWNRLWGK